MENLIVTNKAVVRGTIVSIHGKNNNGSMTIACPVITHSRKRGVLESSVRVNYPVVSFNSSTKTEGILDHFRQGQKVTIEGYVQSYLRMDDFGDTREIMNLYITTITPDISKMEANFGIAGRIYPEPLNEVYLSGTLTGIVKRGDRALAIRLDASREKKNILNLVYFHAPASVSQSFHIGDEVCILAMVQTVDTKEKKVIHNYQDLVVLDIE